MQTMALWVAALALLCLLSSAAAGASADTTAEAAAADAAAGPSLKRRLQAALDHTEDDAAVQQILQQLPADVLGELESALPARRRLSSKGDDDDSHHSGPQHGSKCPKSKPCPKKKDPCDATFGKAKKVTAVMFADIGSFTGIAEGVFYAANLKNGVTISENNTVCASRAYGTLVGEPVVLIATGIGPVATSICLAEVLQCASRVKEILYSGTSGWTPQVGGVINSDECDAAQADGSAARITRVGDICVSPLAINWNCKLTDYEQQVVGAPDLCSLPQNTFGPDASFLYGQCVFTTPDPASLALTQRVHAAATAANAAAARPKRTTTVSDYEAAYFGNMSSGTGVDYEYSSTATPTIWNYTTCAEVDSQYFYSGPPYDEESRTYIQDFLSAGLNMTISKKDVLVVSAMEAIGVAELIGKFGADPGNPKIPYTVIRGNSNYLYRPIRKLPDGTWGYVPNPPTISPTTGYAYAIATTSDVVMSYLKAECIAEFGNRSKKCAYTIDYPGTISGAR